VVLDTLVVRSILVTALNLDLSDRIWWPSRPPTNPASQVARDEELAVAERD
jgi:RND superfamily putative drug exporter